MAWKAECNRRKWYCILGWDAVSWFSEYSYNEWRRSLTPAQIRKLEEYEKKQKEKREKDFWNTYIHVVSVPISSEENSIMSVRSSTAIAKWSL